MTKKRKRKQAVTETNSNEAGMESGPGRKEVRDSNFGKGPVTKEERVNLDKYRQSNDRRLKELEYEHRNGYLPPKPWYETEGV